MQRPELANVGFYFLFGVADNGHEMAYIGEAEDYAERLKQHQRNKDFWNYAVVIISQTHAFTKTHVKYLEYVAIKKAGETNRYELGNSAIPNRPILRKVWRPMQRIVLKLPRFCFLPWASRYLILWPGK